MKLLGFLLLLAHFSSICNSEWKIQPWPNVFSSVQYQYWTLSDGSFAVQNSSLFYNYDKLSYRNDVAIVGGSLPSSVPNNVSSLWLNNTLSIIQYPYNGGGGVANCTSLDLGFGMPFPSWFINDSMLVENGSMYTGNGLWLIHHLDVLSGGNDGDISQSMKNTFHLKKNTPDGYFNYYAVNDDIQTPFRLDAPSGGYSGLNWIVNDFYNFTSPGLADDDGAFDLPSVYEKRMHYRIRKYQDIMENDHVYMMISSLGPVVNYHIKNCLQYYQ